MANGASEPTTMVQPVHRSPLQVMSVSERNAHAGAVGLSEREPSSQLVLRGSPAESGFVSSVAGVLGFELPLKANRSSGGTRQCALWMGPKEWLIVLPPEGGAALARELQVALREHHAAVVDVSHSRVVFGLSGIAARDVLYKGCAIDLHPREFGPGQCVQTRLGRCHMLLHQIDDAPNYDIYVHRSFARYAWAWLLDAGAEFGIDATAND